jgi:hypothetical protein
LWFSFLYEGDKLGIMDFDTIKSKVKASLSLVLIKHHVMKTYDTSTIKKTYQNEMAGTLVNRLIPEN